MSNLTSLRNFQRFIETEITAIQFTTASGAIAVLPADLIDRFADCAHCTIEDEIRTKELFQRATAHNRDH